MTNEKLLYHLCLICGSQMFMHVEEHNKSIVEGEFGSIMYNCCHCPYPYSVDGIVDVNDPILFNSDDVKLWFDEDWAKQKKEYLEANPKDAFMLRYQLAVTKASNRVFAFSRAFAKHMKSSESDT